MSDDAVPQVMAAASFTPAGLDAHGDARSLVRLIQCQICSKPLRTPVTLPCGQSLCRQCLPTTHPRGNISYLATPNRQGGITCPFVECGQEHPDVDCSVNVVLVQVMEDIERQIRSHNSIALASRQTSMDEILSAEPSPDEMDPFGDAEKVADDNEHAIEEDPRISADAEQVLEQSEKMAEEVETVPKATRTNHSKTSTGGRLQATYAFAATGELRYTSDVIYNDHTEAGNEQSITEDNALLDRIKESAYKEMECHVCYHLMLNPVTTPCGHTFCRKCLARILDHARLCPICRRELPLPPSLSRHPNNKVLCAIMNALCPDQVAAREEAVSLEERSASGGLDTSLFVCSPAFPTMPTFLHVFEPRYRLMIRRAIEATGHFGMIAYNERGLPQGRGGRTQFMEIGTLVHIDHYQFLADGRSFIQCRGVSRFRVLAHGMLDGYTVARVEGIEDVSLEEEERLEAEETSVPVPITAAEPGESTAATAATADLAAQVDRVPTRELLAIGVDFVARARVQSAPWLHGRIVEAYGEPPDDPATFPYWFASVLPLSDQEKYKLLPTTSVRERCKITARWVQRIQAQRWYVLGRPLHSFTLFPVPTFFSSEIDCR